MEIHAQVRRVVGRVLTGKGAEFGECISEGSMHNPETLLDGLDYIACTQHLEHVAGLLDWWDHLRCGGRLICVLPDSRFSPAGRWELSGFREEALQSLPNAMVREFGLLDRAGSFFVVFVKGRGNTRQKVEPSGPVALFVAASCGVSGGVKVIWNCAQALRERGWHTQAVFNGGTWGCHPAPWDEFELLQAMPTGPVDLAVATFHRTWPIVARSNARNKLALAQSDEPEWYRPNGSDYNFTYRNFTTPGLKHVGISRQMAEFTEKYGHDIIGLMDNGVDTTVFYPEGVSRLPFKRTMLSIRKGNKVWFDGQEHSDAAAAELAKVLPGFHYLTVGSVETLYGVKRFPEWENFTTYDEHRMRSIYNSAGVYVIPSGIEGNSLTVLEAFATGCCVVGTDGASDYLVDGETGLVVPSGDAGAIVEAVKRIFGDQGLRDRLWYNGLKVAREKTMENQRRQFAGIVERLMA